MATQLQSPARGAHFGACGHEYFWARLGTNHAADVAAVEDGAAGPAREAALAFDEGRTDLGDSGDNRRRFRHLAAAQQIFVEAGERQAPRGDNRGLLAGKIATLVHKYPRRCPVKQPGVEMRQTKMPREIARERALAGSGRSVDGDNH